MHMIMSLLDNLILCFFLFLSCIRSLIHVHGADPDPLTDFASKNASFVLRDLFKNGDVSVDSGGIRAAVSTNNFPASISQGISYVRFKMQPCGVNLPHTHPRATEMLTLLSGGPLQAGFVDTMGVAHINIMYPGDVTIFPRGHLHYEINVGKAIADYISALNSQNPGTLTTGGSLFHLPARALATSLNQRIQAIKKINSTLYAYGPGLKLSSRSECIPGKDIRTDF